MLAVANAVPHCNGQPALYPNRDGRTASGRFVGQDGLFAVELLLTELSRKYIQATKTYKH